MIQLPLMQTPGLHSIYGAGHGGGNPSWLGRKPSFCFFPAGTVLTGFREAFTTVFGPVHSLQQAILKKKSIIGAVDEKALSICRMADLPRTLWDARRADELTPLCSRSLVLALLLSVTWRHHRGHTQVATATTTRPTTTTTKTPPPTPATNKVVGYSGETKNGVRHGRGFQRWDNGDTYEGEWHKGQCDGWGVFHWARGDWFEGLFRGGHSQRGTIHSRGGCVEWEGEWRTTEKNPAFWGVERRAKKTETTGDGHATATVDNVYNGQWDGYKWNGCGTWHSPDTGDIYHGQFDHGKRSGTGRMLFGGDNKSEGDGGGSYIGEWKDDMFHGRGVRLWANGDRYEGQWKDGKEHGEGMKRWCRDGSSFSGLWEMGVPKKGTRKWPNGDQFEGIFTQSSQCGGSGGWGCCGEGVVTLSSENNSLLHFRGLLNGNTFQQTITYCAENYEASLVRHKMGLYLQTEVCMREGNHQFLALPALENAFTLATQFQTQLQKASSEFVLLEKSLATIIQSLQGATQHNQSLASHLRELVALKDGLGKKLDATCEECKKALGQTLTDQSSESEIQQCSRNISELTKKLLEIKPVTPVMEATVLVPSPPKGFHYLMQPLILRVQQPPDVLSTTVAPFNLLTYTLSLLQGCNFSECTMLADKHTMLSKELAEQITLGHNLHNQIEKMQGACTDLMREHKSKWMLVRGLEGDERFIQCPDVQSLLSPLLPQAQQAIIDLMVSKAASLAAALSSSQKIHQQQIQQPQQPPGTATKSPALQGCTAAQQQLTTPVLVEVCIECDEEPPNVILHPCGHAVLCSECAATVRKCPQCRAPITQKQLKQ
ncbi:TIR protein [Pelomyxa schiedti]|nr:TIR protein [Pelomyxa schiedti]